MRRPVSARNERGRGFVVGHIPVHQFDPALLFPFRTRQVGSPRNANTISLGAVGDASFLLVVFLMGRRSSEMNPN